MIGLEDRDQHMISPSRSSQTGTLTQSRLQQQNPLGIWWKPIMLEATIFFENLLCTRFCSKCFESSCYYLRIQMKKLRIKHEDTWLTSGWNQNLLPGNANLEPMGFIRRYSASEISNKYTGHKDKSFWVSTLCARHRARLSTFIINISLNTNNFMSGCLRDLSTFQWRTPWIKRLNNCPKVQGVRGSTGVVCLNVHDGKMFLTAECRQH